MGYVAPPPPPRSADLIRQTQLAFLANFNGVGTDFLRSASVAGPRLNLDRFGMPRDYATYMWLLYRRVVEDDSPARRAFLNGPGDLRALRPNPTVASRR